MPETSQGPFCTQILADYGTEVLKVENPKGVYVLGYLSLVLFG